MSQDFASIVIIKRTGTDGPRFPLRRNECLFGRDTTCDLRIQLPGVALEHAKVSSSENQNFFLQNLSENETVVNGNPIQEPVQLNNMDVFSIAGRSFRFEYKQPKRKSSGQNLVSPLKEVNRAVIDSPRNPVPRRQSLRESLGELRRSSVPFQEVPEPKTPDKVERTENSLARPASPKEDMSNLRRSSLPSQYVNEQPDNHIPRRVSLRESIGKLRRSFVPFREIDEPVSNTPNPLPCRASLIESGGKFQRSSVEVHEKEPALSTPEEKPFAVAANTSYRTTPLSTMKHRKRVSFGPALSPEQFDKTLPVVTPIKKGATPRRLSVPLSKPCLSPARRRYSVAVPSLVEKIEEEGDESEGKSDDESSKADSPAVEIVDSCESMQPKLATPVKAGVKEAKELRETSMKMGTPLRNAIKQGFRLKASKKKLNTPLRQEIKAGKKLRPTRKRLDTPVRKAIEGKPKLRPCRARMATPIRKEIEAKRDLRPTKRVMEKDLQDEIKRGVPLKQIKKVLPEPLQEEIKTARKLLRIKRRVTSELQGEIMVGQELHVTGMKMAAQLQEAIVKGVQLRPTRRRMATMLQDEIKTGVELSKTKQSLKTPIRKEIEAGKNLRKTKRRMGTMLQCEIKSGIELCKTKQSLKTPIRKEIESGVSLRKTKRRMGTMLQCEIKSGVELSKTKQSLKTPIRKAIESGVSLRKTKRRMPTMLQNDIKSGIELSKTKPSLKTPIRKEIESGVNLRKTKLRMATSLQNEIKSGIKLSKTKQTLETPITKNSERGVQLPSAKHAAQDHADDLPKTPKRRLSSVDDDASKSRRKKLKTPSKTPQQTGFFPRDRSRSRSISRPKSARKPSYAEIVKRAKIVAKRRLSAKQAKIFQFEAAQKMVCVPKATGSKIADSSKKILKKNRTPSRRKSVSQSKAFDGRIASDWNVVVNKRKMKRIKRQRAVKPQQELDLDGFPGLFKTPTATQSQKRVAAEKETRSFRTPTRTQSQKRVAAEKETRSFRTPTRKCRRSSSLSDEVLYSVAKLMKTPRIQPNNEPDIEGVAELFEILEVASPLAASSTPSLRRESDRMSIVGPLSVNETPSLKSKETVNDVILPLQLSSTPSLRKSIDSSTVAFPQEPLCTPSLRGASEPLSVACAEELAQTPSLKQDRMTVTVVTADTPRHSPSLRRASGCLSVVFAEKPTVTPSLKQNRETIAVVAPEALSQSPSLRPASECLPVEFAQEPKKTPSLEQKEKDITIVTPECPQTPFLKNVSNVLTASPTQTTSPPDTTASSKKPPVSVVSPFPDSSVHAKGLSPVAESNISDIQTIPPTVQCSVTQQTSSTDKSTSKQTEKPSISKTRTSKRSTRSKRKAEPESLPAAKRPRRAPSQNTTTDTVVAMVDQKSDVPFEIQSLDVKPESLPTTKRPRRAASQNTTITDTVVAIAGLKTEAPGGIKSQMQKRTKARQGKQPPRTGKQPPRAGKQPARPGIQPSVESVVVDQYPKHVVDLAEQIDQKFERNTRSKNKVLKCRSEDSKNVAGVPETPQPLQFTRTKLEPIIEVPTPRPTPASSVRGSAVKKSSVNCKRSTRSNIPTVVEEIVQPVINNGNDQSSCEGRTSKSKRKAYAKKSVSSSDGLTSEAVSYERRTTRAKRKIDTAIVEDDLPALKRRKTKDEKEKKIDEGKATVENEKRRGRQTRMTVLQEEVDETAPTRSGKKRASQIKGNDNGKKSVSNVKEMASEAVPSEKRTTRSKRGIATAVVEEDLPALKRQKAKEVKEEKIDEGKTVEKEKRPGRQTRMTALKKEVDETAPVGIRKVDEDVAVERETKRNRPKQKTTCKGTAVEDVNTRSTRTTRRKKSTVKEVEVVEETVVKFTRTTRKRSKPVEEDVVDFVEDKDRKASKENTGTQIVEQNSRSDRKVRITTRQRRAVVRENENAGVPPEIGDKKCRTRSQRATTTEDTTERVTRVTRSQRAAK